MPPLKRRGGPRSDGEVRPPALTLWIAVVVVSSSVLRERQLQPLPGFPPKDGGKLGKDVKNFTGVNRDHPASVWENAAEWPYSYLF